MKAKATKSKEKTFTITELRGYLEDLYCETAGGYNDYGRHASDYTKQSVREVQSFLEMRGLVEKPEIEKKAIALKKSLEQFGDVEQCGEEDGMFHVKITTGFNNEIGKSSGCMEVVRSAVCKDYPNVHKMKLDGNLFHLILKKA